MGAYDKCLVKMGSGRAICRACGGKIKTDEVAIEIRAYQVTRQVHGDPKDCNRMTATIGDKNE